MIKRKYFCLFVLLSFSFSLFSQEITDRYSLNQLLDSAIQKNYILRANETQKKIKKAELEILKTNYQPSIATSLSFSYWKFLMPNKEKLLGNAVTDVYTDITIHQTIYDWGQNKIKKEMVADEMLINDEVQKQIISTIIWGVSDVYFEILKAKSEVEAHVSAINQLKSHLQYAGNLYNLGKVTNIDILKISVQLSVEERALQKAQNNTTALKIRLKRLCNLNENSAIQIDNISDSLFLSKQYAVFNANELYNQVSNNHPELISLNHKITLEKRQKEIYRLLNRPELFSYGIASWEDGYIPYGNNFNYNIGVGIRYTIPYFGGSGFKTKMVQSDLNVEQIGFEKHQAFLEIKEEIDMVINEMDDRKTEINHNEIIIRLASETLNNSLVLYQSGQGNIIDVLDAQAVLTEAQINKGKSISAYLQSIAKVNYISGSSSYPF